MIRRGVGECEGGERRGSEGNSREMVACYLNQQSSPSLQAMDVIDLQVHRLKSTNRGPYR